MKLYISMVLAGAVFISGASLAFAQSSVQAVSISPTIGTTDSTEVESEDGHVGTAFVLDGSRSIDDGTVSRFIWKQIGGPTVTIASAATSKASFTPTVAGTYVFELTVTDASGLSSVEKRIKVEVAPKSSATLAAPVTTIASTTTSKPTVMPIKAITGDDDAEGKGNVEMNWKVEEGEKGAEDSLEIEIGDDGSSDDESAAEDRTRDLKNAGPVDGWPVQVSAVEVRGWDPEKKQEFLATVKAWAEVKSEQDLENFATGAMLADDRPTETLSLNFEKIKFTHAVPAKFLGIFGSSLTAETEVAAGSEVSVKFPWYAFLYRKEVKASEFKDAIDSALNLPDDGIVRADASGSWSFSAQAEAIETVSNVLKTKHDTAKNSIGNIR